MFGWSWGSKPEKAKDQRALHEKAFRRGPLAAWDEAWHRLSPGARLAFLDDVKAPKKSTKAQQAGVPTEKFDPKALDELIAAGFVEVRQAGRVSALERSGRVFSKVDPPDFIGRVHALRRHHLLEADPPPDLLAYVNHCFYSGAGGTGVQDVLQKAGMGDIGSADSLLLRYVPTRYWPGWAVDALGDPVAARVLAAVRKADGPTSLIDLLGRVENVQPNKARVALDQLIARLVLFEDLDPKTLDIRVGLLPAVRADLKQSDKPRTRPPLAACEGPAEVGPEEGLIIGDLRAYLLELASEPAQLRQDHSLFQKEAPRFLAALDPLPGWLTVALKLDDADRINQAHTWAMDLGLASEKSEGSRLRLRLSPKGQEWPTTGLDRQYARVYEALQPVKVRDELANPYGYSVAVLRDLEADLDDLPYASSYYSPVGDAGFLGSPLLVLKPGKKGTAPSPWQAKADDVRALRESIYEALATPKADAFYRVDGLAAHLAYGADNPLNLGLEPAKVAVYWSGRPVPPLEERREEVGRQVLINLILARLIPLGCVRAAVDGEGKLCVARSPRLDAYFGRKVKPADLAGVSAGAAETRVVVQPDYSIAIIGLDPAPAAALAPFCERSSRGGGPGAVLLKLTRESVVKAIGHGLKPGEILARLEKYASHDLPANVRREVVEWSAWVRPVTIAPITLIRCPDRESADRVVGALRSRVDRLNDTTLALDNAKLTPADRDKLRSQGILIQTVADPKAPKPKAKRRRRGW